MTTDEILKEAILKWGNESQMDMVIEECAELIQAINKYKRSKSKDHITETYNNLCSEVADVEIMIQQARIILNPKIIDNHKEVKINRLKTRLGL